MSNYTASSSATVLLAMLFAGSALAADPTPELKPRAPGTAQAIGAVHTLRQIPEACARLEGVFTGNAAQPYTFSVVRSSPPASRAHAWLTTPRPLPALRRAGSSTT